jgi:hypothetical protein
MMVMAISNNFQDFIRISKKLEKMILNKSAISSYQTSNSKSTLVICDEQFFQILTF